MQNLLYTCILKMKVTVYFGNVRVIVPCGNGDILVRELMDLAITRYKKATGKTPPTWVTIHNLKSSRDEGILYPDDYLNDVADDREQIIAIYEEHNSFSLPHTGDNRTALSSVEESPDSIQGDSGSTTSKSGSQNCTDVEIIEDYVPLGMMPLQVRRGSEPALNCLLPSPFESDPTKRWSTAVVMNTVISSKQDCQNEPVDVARLPHEHQSNENRTNFRPSSINDDCTITLTLKTEAGPLGIHVVPNYDDSTGKDAGLIIQAIEQGGRIDRDGRLKVGDQIIEINEKSLLSVNFQEAQKIFKDALMTPEINLCVVKKRNRRETLNSRKKPPSPVFPKPYHNQSERCPDEISLAGEKQGGLTAKVATVAPAKIIPPSVQRSINISLTANTRKIGKKISIGLIKGSVGLGFSITTRDNPAGGNCPIYIKNILPKGAAVEDGRLRPGDRLLEVNGIKMTGKSQMEAVTVLRNMPLGSCVELVVSRQEVDPSESPRVLKELPPDKTVDEVGIFPWKHREILTFQIPLSKTGSAGLGISVKGKSTAGPNGPVDLGIFVKAVIHGGAAAKDGRLKTNDQMVNIDGISLLNMSNTQAMETLRHAMTYGDGPISNTIILTVARRILPPGDEIQEHTGLHQRNDSSLSANEYSPSCQENAFLSNRNNAHMTTNSHVPKQNKTAHDENEDKYIEKDFRVGTHLPGCNPVIERITRHNTDGWHSSFPSSYFQHFTKDTLGRSPVQMNLVGSQTSSICHTTHSPTINMLAGETVMIEDEYLSQHKLQNCVAVPEESSTSSLEKSEVIRDVLDETAGKDFSSTCLFSQVNDNGELFSRDGFGRQSMSEKRHAQLDARNTDTYQRNKKARDGKDRQKYSEEQPLEQKHSGMEYLNQQQKHKESLHKEFGTLSETSSLNKEPERLGPTLGMRKSSSLESLQTMLQDLQQDDVSKRKVSKPCRASRGRRCNESFRAAVDRSYEAPVSDSMETLDEESESGSSAGHLPTSSTGESVTNQHPCSGTDIVLDDMLHSYVKDAKIIKKKGGIFKGLGSVFKFGKNRKLSSDIIRKINQDEKEISETAQVERFQVDRSSVSSRSKNTGSYSHYVDIDQQKRQFPESKINDHTHLWQNSPQTLIPHTSFYQKDEPISNYFAYENNQTRAYGGYHTLEVGVNSLPRKVHGSDTSKLHLQRQVDKKLEQQDIPVSHHSKSALCSLVAPRSNV